MMTTDEVAGFLPRRMKGKHTVVGVVGVNPFETVPVKLDLMESGLGGVDG